MESIDIMIPRCIVILSKLLRCAQLIFVCDHLRITLMSFLHVQTHVTSLLRIIIQHTILYPPYLLHPPFIITRFYYLPNYNSHLSPCKILLYQAFQFYQMRLLGYHLIPSCISLDLSFNHSLVVLLNTTCLRYTLCIIILHLISILYLLPTSLPFHIYFITCIASIIVVLVDLLFPYVLHLVPIVLKNSGSFRYNNYFRTALDVLIYGNIIVYFRYDHYTDRIFGRTLERSNTQLYDN